MAIPASYTEESLAEYMHAVLAEVATALAWSVAAGSYEEAVNEALAVYGVDAISEVSGRANLKKLRALARVEIWRQVVRSTTGDFDFSADGGKYSRSQVNEQARKQLELELNQAMAYGLDGYEVSIDKLRHIHDPYEYVEDDDRVIP